jgi:hypothetical protein
VLRICGPKRDAVTGGWRKLHNEEFVKYNYKIEENEVGGTCGTNGGEDECV